MNRYNSVRKDESREFDDALGQMVRWSLRGDAGRRTPPPAVWHRVQARAQAWDRRPPRSRQAARLCMNVLDGVLSVLDFSSGLLLHAMRYVDERTFSSEAVWQDDGATPRSAMALRYRLTVQVVSAGPLLGQRLPII
jgi:hypothetical protein